VQAADINWRRLGEGTDGMYVIVENDNRHHDPETKHHRLLIGKLGPVLPEYMPQSAAVFHHGLECTMRV